MARKSRIGRLRDDVEAANWWVAAPAQRLKDLDPARRYPPNAVALTFDDGPHPHVTPKLLEVLDSHSALATFFMCGNPASRYPDVVRSVVAAGHSIGGHTWDHKEIPGLTPDEWTYQVQKTHDVLGEMTGQPIRWFRPPRGHDTKTSRVKLREHRVVSVLWSASGRDWRLEEPHDIANSVLKDLEPGGIALLHDTITEVTDGKLTQRDQMKSVRATEQLLEAMSDRGLSAVALDSIEPSRLPITSRPLLGRTNTAR